MIKFKRLIFGILIFALFCVLFQCGTRDAKIFDVSLVNGDDTIFTIPSEVVDIFYLFQDLTSPERNVIYPEECALKGFEQDCGFKIGEEVKLKLCFESCDSENSEQYIPLEDDIVLVFCARDIANKVIYKGISAVFHNDPINPPGEIIIYVDKKDPGLDSCLY